MKTGPDEGIVFAGRDIWTMVPGSTQLEWVAQIVGSRPLTVTSDGNSLYYGEYRRNEERRPVQIWAACRKGYDWQAIYSFEQVRHIHGVFHDPYTRGIWTTTGDFDSESGLWWTGDGFFNVVKVAGGSQQYRAVQLLFSRDAVYFGSDVPAERNYLYRLDRESGVVSVLTEVGGPVFFGCKVGDYLFFSTVVEPCKEGRLRYAEVWGSYGGEEWCCIRSYKKDLWPMKLFQYGQVRFPLGPGDGESVWMAQLSTKQDASTVRVKLKDLMR
jgi:hypothetical protein